MGRRRDPRAVHWDTDDGGGGGGSSKSRGVGGSSGSSRGGVTGVVLRPLTPLDLTDKLPAQMAAALVLSASTAKDKDKGQQDKG